MISVALAAQLRDSGLRWTPARGDRFIVAGKGMDDEVFVLSDMTIEVHDYPTGPIIGFNGTTEWALDSLEQNDALWLPREDQLRDLLGSAFAALHRAEAGGFRVATGAGEFSGDVAEDAYARAVLSVLS